MKVRRGVDGNGRSYWILWCPGCEHMHQVTDLWEVTEEPAFTVHPSVLVHPNERSGRPRCHSFIRAGYWEFLTDSTHALAGQTVPMVDLPAWLTHPPEET